MAAKVASGLPLPIPSFGAGAEDDKVEALSDALKSFGGAIDGALEESDPLAKEALAPRAKWMLEKFLETSWCRTADYQAVMEKEAKYQ